MQLSPSKALQIREREGGNSTRAVPWVKHYNYRYPPKLNRYSSIESEMGLDTIEKYAYDNDHDWHKEYDEMFDRLNNQRIWKTDEGRSVHVMKEHPIRPVHRVIQRDHRAMKFNQEMHYRCSRDCLASRFALILGCAIIGVPIER